MFRFNSRVFEPMSVCHLLVGRRMNPLVQRGGLGRIPDKGRTLLPVLCSFGAVVDRCT